MAPRNTTFSLLRRTGLASIVACASFGALAFAAGGDPHAPPSKPETPAKLPPVANKTPKAPAKAAPAGEAAPKADHGDSATKGEKHAAPAAPEHGEHRDTTSGNPSEHASDPHANTTPPAAPAHDPHADATSSVSADQALRRLIEGNARFAHDLDNTTERDPSRRPALASGQHPFAIILSCADSRVPPELLFDQELGDLFVVRLAGNTADDAALGSIEYAVDHLGSKLIMVMGHTKCGAVKAAVETNAAGKQPSELPGHLPAVVSSIMPAVTETKGMQGDAVRLAVIRNVQRTVQSLQRCAPILSQACESKGVRVIGAIYDLDSGEVDLVPELSGSNGGATFTAGASGSDEKNEH